MNTRGHPETLRASHPGNTHRGKHGCYSERMLAPRAAEIRDALMASPHVTPLDEIAASEIGSLLALIEAIDRDLAEQGLTDHKGNARSLLDLRIRASGRLKQWLQEFGATPASRVEWVERVSRAESLAAIMRGELEEGARLLDQARSQGVLRGRGKELP